MVDRRLKKKREVLNQYNKALERIRKIIKGLPDCWPSNLIDCNECPFYVGDDDCGVAMIEEFIEKARKRR